VGRKKAIAIFVPDQRIWDGILLGHLKVLVKDGSYSVQKRNGTVALYNHHRGWVAKADIDKVFVVNGPEGWSTTLKDFPNIAHYYMLTDLPNVATLLVLKNVRGKQVKECRHWRSVLSAPGAKE